MIIKDLNISEYNDFASLECQISWNNNPFEKVFIAVPAEYRKYLDENDADPFLIIFLIIACKYDEDIVIENATVNAELCDNIEKIMIPAFAKMGNGTGKTKIIADKVQREADNSEKIGATGISLGVDSFYSILTNIKDKNKDKPINAVCLRYSAKSLKNINTGDLYKFSSPKKEVAQKLGLEFILFITNISFFCDKEFSFVQYHSFCNLGILNSIKKHIFYYYYASGYSTENLKLSILGSAYYDNIIETVLNYNEFKMISSGGEVSRFEKTKYISNIEIVQKYLDVCLYYKNKNKKLLNCTYCQKCIRTLITLDIIGIIDKYNKVFDIEFYKKNKNKLLGEMLYDCFHVKDLYSIEIYDKAKKYNYYIPILSWYYMIIHGCNRILKKYIKD